MDGKEDVKNNFLVVEIKFVDGTFVFKLEHDFKQISVLGSILKS